jgi:hypothetical protein
VHGSSTGRLYYGTDTRAQALLIGAAVAAAMALRAPGSRRTPRLALLGACAVVWAFHALSGTEPLLYRGGFTAVALATAAVVAGVIARPRAVMARVLSARPVRSVGTVSYELYLWHWPVLLAATRARTGLRGMALLGARAGVTAVLAVACYTLIDEPLRQRSRRAVRRLAAPAVGAFALTASVAVIGVAVAPPASSRAARARLAGVVRAPVGLASAVGAAAPAAPGRVAVTTAGGRSAQPLAALPEGLETPAAPSAAVAVATPSATVAVPAAPSATVAIPAAPSVAQPAGPLRAVLLGDSVALTLGDGLLDRQAGSGVDVVDGGLIGCGVMGAGEVRVGGATAAVTAGCANWETGWRDLVSQVRPAVAAILVGRWEVVDRVVDGRWAHVGEPAFDAMLSAQLDHAIAAASSKGARVLLLTAPYYAGVERPDGGTWPEDDPARVDRFNSLLRAAAGRAPGDVRVLDLGALADPEGRYTPVLDGTTARRADGVHFTQAGADLLAPTVLNALAS